MDEQDITIKQAGELLKVSERSVVKILENGEIPYRIVEAEPRLKLTDVLGYKKRRDANRREKLIELVRISEEAGLYNINEFPKKED